MIMQGHREIIIKVQEKKPGCPGRDHMSRPEESKVKFTNEDLSRSKLRPGTTGTRSLAEFGPGRRGSCDNIPRLMQAGRIRAYRPLVAGVANHSALDFLTLLTSKLFFLRIETVLSLI